MIEGLELLLSNKHKAGVAELRIVLQELLGEKTRGRLLSEEKLLRSRVYRLKFEIGNNIRSFVVKQLTPSLAQLERSVAEKWLPLARLSENGPPLVGAAAEKSGKCIWHIYDDIGDSSLTNYIQDELIARKAIDLIAQVHKQFAGHIILGECRMSGGNYNIEFYSLCVQEALRTLEIVQSSTKNLPYTCSSVIDSLLQRLSHLYAMRSDREKIMFEYNGIETLVHGDLWTKNFLVQHVDPGFRVLLIDWDHVGVGSVYYDLSTLLMRFTEEDRPKILGWYQEAIDSNWLLPENYILNTLFEAAEYARLANATIWPAIAAGKSQAEWAFNDLSNINDWFENMTPVLPVG